MIRGLLLALSCRMTGGFAMAGRVFVTGPLSRAGGEAVMSWERDAEGSDVQNSKLAVQGFHQRETQLRQF